MIDFVCDHPDCFLPPEVVIYRITNDPNPTRRALDQETPYLFCCQKHLSPNFEVDHFSKKGETFIKTSYDE